LDSRGSRVSFFYIIVITTQLAAIITTIIQHGRLRHRESNHRESKSKQPNSEKEEKEEKEFFQQQKIVLQLVRTVPRTLRRSASTNGKLQGYVCTVQKADRRVISRCIRSIHLRFVRHNLHL